MSLIIGTSLAFAAASACRHNEVASNRVGQNLNRAGANLNASSPSVVESTQELANPQRSSFKPEQGYVPDEQTAIAIAVAVWIPIYGQEQIESERPYRATLRNGVWTVTGTLPEGYHGGTAVAEIAKDDGRILRVVHYQ